MIQTEVLAMWGAVTGTIGTLAGLINLWFRFKQFISDRPHLKCESTFEHLGPKSHKHRVTVRSLGRRPVRIDCINYYIRPRAWWRSLIKIGHHRDGRFIYKDSSPNGKKLDEGESEDFKISMPNGLKVTDIYKVELIDQTGKCWPVKWLSKKRLSQVATQELLNTFSKENEYRAVDVSGHRLGIKFYISGSYWCKGASQNRRYGIAFSFRSFDTYNKKFKDLTEHQCEKYLSGEVDSINREA
ncbi:hypothetical protein [Pseudoalteromonas sp. T1lg88]|uniref:hypothetical protein n=1 Tax=Pseudoalteromonas sp. T1lg88 TaxID=2077104 RepID=UPI000CF60440|nr:hypothetical protein [Pseudoalteromonas sp. T1lg88]